MLLACASTLALVSAQVPLGSNGSASCTCINPFTKFDLNTTGLDENCTLVRNSNGACFAESYGSQGCRPYDDHSTSAVWPTAECVPSLFNPSPVWCEASWCWVDPNECHRPHAPSSFFAGSQFGDQLVYSYETCGNVNEFSDDGRTQELNNKHLRVSFPGASGSGYTIVATPDGQGIGGSNRDGSVVRFFAAIAQEYNISWSVVPVSEESKAFSPSSSFTACVHELALNATDICVGNFWPTPSRRRIASFTSDIYSDDFHLVVRMANGTSTASGLAQYFSLMINPFDAATWFVLLLTILYFGAVMWLLEAGQNQEDFPERAPLKGLALGMYKAFFAITTLDFRFTPSTFAGRLVLCVFSITSMLMVTFYSSQVTSNMVDERAMMTTVKSLDEAISRKFSFCMLAAIEGAVKSRYKELDNERSHTVTNAQEVFNGLDSGLCKAGFVTADEWRKAQNAQCHNKVKLESIVLSSGNAYPVRSDLQAPLSWAIAKSLVSGAYDPYRRAAQRDYLSAIDTTICDDTDSAAEGSRRLGLSKTGGPMLISILVCTLAALLFVRDDRRRSATRKRIKSNKGVAARKSDQLADIIKEPTLYERTVGMGRVDAALEKEAERESPAYDNQDLKLISKMYRSRDMTQVRINAASSIRTDGALSLNDVPMLLKVMRETFAISLQSHEANPQGQASQRPGLPVRGFSYYLRDSSVLDDDADEEPPKGGVRQGV